MTAMEGPAHPFLPHLDAARILAFYRDAPGDEIASGKFASDQSSAQLVANAFGFFVDRPEALPPFACGDWRWPPRALTLETLVRFPWSGGKHPCLDVLVATDGVLLGIESKRYEPFRGKPTPEFSNAFGRDKWGTDMSRHLAMIKALKEGREVFRHLDAAQLVKHALALRTAVHREGGPFEGRTPALLYLHADPAAWPDGRPIPDAARARHREEIARYAAAIAGDEVAFAACDYRTMLDAWSTPPDPAVRAHAAAVAEAFRIGPPR